ncbi:peptide/nickel transport system ATP-binding protein [Hoeflea marina]|uniref:Peptide/nickel transport system ATP-binding protein n=1 Tax=Hoeflea marina TaxID=274592 RepID=A0A317PT09_9HYPH|nr:ABC transporter ATP-binding protein [Hoeflea marina]PWW03764.1 peptide/nickel transport system ATP-binding protein [Hoeflea marina]
MSSLLEVRNLVTEFAAKPDRPGLRAVNDVSFSLERGKVLGLVGESGSGKSVTGFSIMGLVDRPGKVTGGQILFDGVDLVGLDPDAMRRLRGRRIAMVFQDPMMTLNPVLSIRTQMVEAIHAHEDVSERTAHERARDALGQVGIPSPEERLASYPHEFSGGMRQRVAIAIALLHKPDLIIADEPTTALDVTIQSQIIAEFQTLAEVSNTAVIWITHDLAIVSRLADELAVMYAGRLVETGGVSEVLNTPRHPYTRGLIASVPSQNRRGERLRQIPGVSPNMADLPQGCSFRPRCDRALPGCLSVPPQVPEAGRSYRCINPVMEAQA